MTVDAGLVLPVPEAVDLVEAAGLPEVAATVWSNVFGLGRLAAGEALLVHGGSSGIGTMAIQLGRAFGADVIATAGSDEKAAFCREVGAQAAVNYRDQDFVEASARSPTGAASTSSSTSWAVRTSPATWRLWPSAAASSPSRSGTGNRPPSTWGC